MGALEKLAEKLQALSKFYGEKQAEYILVAARALQLAAQEAERGLPNRVADR